MQLRSIAPNTARRRTLWLGLGFGVWLCAAAAGMVAVIDYGARPSAEASAARWPERTSLALSPTALTLVMAVHPECPCSHASVAAIATLAARFPGGLAATLLFVLPDGTPDDWQRTSLVEEASAIPGVRVRFDRNGVEAARFGARTSGQTYVFAKNGELRFRGGLTTSRGHAGDSAGTDAVEALLRDEAPVASATPVFGCALDD